MEHHYASSFGDLLRIFRKRKGLSQQDLAQSLQVHRNTIGAWERGDRLPDTRGVVLEIAQRMELDDADTLQLLEASLTALAPHWCGPTSAILSLLAGMRCCRRSIRGCTTILRARLASLAACSMGLAALARRRPPSNMLTGTPTTTVLFYG